MSSIRLVHSARLVHAEYADAALVEAGSELVFLAGVCPLDENGATVAPGDVAQQMRQTLANLDLVLEGCELTLADVANVRISVATQSRADLRDAWGVFREHFGEHDVPASLVGVTVLGYGDQLVEIEVVAARTPLGRDHERPDDRGTPTGFGV